MQETDPRAAVQAFRARSRATLARLQRVNAALARWDEHEAAILVPLAKNGMLWQCIGIPHRV